MSNPAATPCIVEDLQGDGRWMSMVMATYSTVIAL